MIGLQFMAEMCVRMSGSQTTLTFLESRPYQMICLVQEEMIGILGMLLGLHLSLVHVVLMEEILMDVLDKIEKKNMEIVVLRLVVVVLLLVPMLKTYPGLMLQLLSGLLDLSMRLP